MKVFITGICGFVGTRLADELSADHEVCGADNLCRSGSEINRRKLMDKGIRVIHADLRLASDLENLPTADWVIEAAANPSVLAGLDGKTSSRQLTEQNLLTTINTLEYCKRHNAGFILLSTSRVYSIPPLSSMPVQVDARRFIPELQGQLPGMSPEGISESFSTHAPVSLYGATKLASETMALEYGETFGFPVWINRCGVMAGAGQFGRPDQGIFAYWIHSFREGAPLKYIGFGGKGYQVRDCLHPNDLAGLIKIQMTRTQGDNKQPRIYNVSGGLSNAMSLAELTDWCNERFGVHEVAGDNAPRPFDLPWVVLDSSRAKTSFEWIPKIKIQTILEEIAVFSRENASWLSLSK